MTPCSILRQTAKTAPLLVAMLCPGCDDGNAESAEGDGPGAQTECVEETAAAETDAAALVHGLYADVFNDHDLDKAADYILSLIHI
ncbi:MAG: hypothetical protein KUG77_10600 [Nannocystaceae bacterium]|nr:hypothetical protein [Nannocystaceae bacterium]